MSQGAGSIIIENVQPQLEGGRYPVKRAAGERVRVSADVFKEGHDELVVVARYRQLTPRTDEPREVRLQPLGNDAWAGEFPIPLNGLYGFVIEAWPDQVRTWADELRRKVEAGREVQSELLEGAVLLRAAGQRAASAAKAADGARLRDLAAALQTSDAIATALDPSLAELAGRYPDRSIATRLPKELHIFAERRRAISSAWYELFPRSAGPAFVHGTFKDVEARLPYVQSLGFDVVYLPPIHPIGRTARKGKNNSLTAAPGDVGSPWAIGAAEGGHKAIHPELGTMADFKHLLAEAKKHGIEIAIDIAFQCSPDHPYVKEHPEWFNRRPDGTIKTAENPPKRYEDIVNFDFMGPGRETLWAELLSVFQAWIDAGVTIFRVDNPHTKPIPFWEWVTGQVHARHPGVIFLSEAFTRPKVMKALAKAGFNQSYTYFTWRNFKGEMEEYLRELTQGPAADSMIGNLWPNTPDILPEQLQEAGRPAFLLRAALAATLSSSWGIYSGFELCENRGLPGKEEYADSEKYQLVHRDFDAPGNIGSFIAALNRIRKQNPALQQYRNLRFHHCDNDHVLFYSKATEDRTNQLLIAVSMDPYAPQEATLALPLNDLGVQPGETIQAHELLSDQRSLWQGPAARVQLTPETPAVIFSIQRFQRSEQGFDYYF
jgi:starch synthase (maltosyl-transferring)